MEEEVKEKKSSTSKTVITILVILVLLLIIVPIILAVLGVISFTAISNSEKTFEEIEKVDKVDEIKENEVEKIVEQVYRLKEGQYWLLSEEPDKPEIEVKIGHSTEKVKYKQIKFDTGLYNIELVKGDNVGIVYNNSAVPELFFNLRFTKSFNKFEEVYISNKYLENNTDEREGLPFYPFLDIYVTDAEGNRKSGVNIEIKFTKLNKEPGVEPVSQSKEQEIIMTEKENDGAYNSAYVVGKSKLKAGVYDIVRLEGASIPQVFRIVPKSGKQFLERYSRDIGLNKSEPESKYIRALKLEEGDQVYFGTKPMGFEDVSEDYEYPDLKPLKLLFIKR